MRPVRLRKLLTSFFVSFPRKVRFGVWINILAKEKFSNLRKKIFSFLFLFLFVSYLKFVNFTFILFCIFLQGAKHNV